ncbi:hypothetical protein FOL46_000473 [Perkinsus olseni]|uniref:Uncharacterized protein n=1 Tax=Perkinsus olseni TaxID=32597 RepID=A0A7J6MVQ8_PEROL|nr:hypothetical protein FOL46_000473 [Perkinsus olseni]
MLANMCMSHIELQMLEEMHVEREERRELRESLTREELERIPREKWDDAYAPGETWEERYERRRKAAKESHGGVTLLLIMLFYIFFRFSLGLATALSPGGSS